MKKLISILAGLVLFLGVSGVSVHAQEASSSLPDAGLTPKSAFYFLDKLSESIQLFFTFNQQAKARLQLEFAKERIAEIRALLATESPTSSSVTAAEDGLKGNLSGATASVDVAKNRGEDVSEVAQEVNDEVDDSQNELKTITENKKEEIKNQEEELQKSLQEARKEKDVQKEEELKSQLESLKNQREALTNKEDEHDKIFEEEGQKLKEHLSVQAEAESKISEAEKKHDELVSEAMDRGVDASALDFKQFDTLLDQAKELLGKGNYEGATQLAEQAIASLERSKQGLESEKKSQEEIKKQEEQSNEPSSTEGQE